MTQIMHYRCDRCGFLMTEPYNIVHLKVSHSENFDLRDSDLDFCKDCEKALVQWLKQKPAEKAA